MGLRFGRRYSEGTSKMALPDGFRAGFGIPQVFPDGPVDVDEIRRVAAGAEARGYDSLWTQDQLLGQASTVEPMALLSYLAALTSTIRLGVSVIVLPTRNPVQLAKTLSAIDVLSGGRLIAGVGLGGGWDAEAFGIPNERRVARFLDVLGAVDALWKEPAAQFSGKWHRFDGTPMNPKPLQRPRPPVIFGARAEPALRRAVRLGDGWMGPGSSTGADFAGQVATLRRLLEAADRDPSTFSISKRVYLAIDDDAARAERRLRQWFGHNYGNEAMANEVSIWGPSAEVQERLDELIAAGNDELPVRHLLLNPVFDFDDHLDALAMYASG